MGQENLFVMVQVSSFHMSLIVESFGSVDRTCDLAYSSAQQYQKILEEELFSSTQK